MKLIIKIEQYPASQLLLIVHDPNGRYLGCYSNFGIKNDILSVYNDNFNGQKLTEFYEINP